MQERIKREEEEHVTAYPGCGQGESVALCLNILFMVSLRLTARCLKVGYVTAHPHSESANLTLNL